MIDKERKREKKEKKEKGGREREKICFEKIYVFFTFCHYICRKNIKLVNIYIDQDIYIYIYIY